MPTRCPPQSPPSIARRLRALLVAAISLAAGFAHAGFVETRDGSRINGRIEKITADEVVISTDFAGTLTLERTKVSRVESPEPVTVKLADATTVTGALVLDEAGGIALENEMLNMTTDASRVAAAWEPAATPPPESGYVAPRDWEYRVGADVAGREGNSDEQAINVAVDARLVSEKDDLHFYTTIEKAERNGQDTADEIIAGGTYTSYFSDPWGWYVRSEVEQDDFENLDLRATLAGGLSYRALNREFQRLRFTSGLGYRYESFQDGTTDSSPTLEFGLEHWYQFRPWLEMQNRLSFAPALNDFADYLFIHDSGFIIPIGTGERWKLRLGMRNDYNNIPAEGRKNLDTSYYSRVTLDW